MQIKILDTITEEQISFDIVLNEDLKIGIFTKEQLIQDECVHQQINYNVEVE